MCFGPVTSITSSIALAAIGVTTVKRACTKRQIPFAAIPLLFAVHQFIEGLLWITLIHREYAFAQPALTVLYLLVALCFWPIYAPISIYLMEESPRRQKLMLPIVLLGALAGVALLTNLLSGTNSAAIKNCSIYYDFLVPETQVGLTFLYVSAVFGATFLSARRSMLFIGIVNLIACFIAAAIYYETFVSVWCFFAALLSIMIYSMFRRLVPGKRVA